MTLEQLKQFLQDMTPGPWYAFDNNMSHKFENEEDHENWSVDSQHGECDEDCPKIDHCHECVTPGERMSEKNAKAIAAMGNASALMLKALEFINDIAGEVTPRPGGLGFHWSKRAKRLKKEFEEIE